MEQPINKCIQYLANLDVLQAEYKTRQKRQTYKDDKKIAVTFNKTQVLFKSVDPAKDCYLYDPILPFLYECFKEPAIFAAALAPNIPFLWEDDAPFVVRLHAPYHDFLDCLEKREFYKAGERLNHFINLFNHNKDDLSRTYPDKKALGDYVDILIVIKDALRNYKN